MGESNKDQHRPWLAYALEESLDQALLAPRDVVDHANPEVLVNPISAITPGIFRQIFDFTGSVPDSAAASSGGEFVPPSTQLRGNFVPPPPQ